MVDRKVCVVTGTRAEYGLLRGLIQRIDQSATLQLQLIVTGMHLSPEFGLTYREIESDGFVIDRVVESLLSSDTPAGIAKSTGLGMIGFADALHQLKPDVLVVLGDRFETLAAVTAALYAKIPIAHLHGGETTEGAFDEGIRHAITKMSHLHFVAADEYRRRVIQLGENPVHVFCVGGLGVDAIKQTPLLSAEEIEEKLDWKLGKYNLLITFHPATLETQSAAQQFAEVTAALESLDPKTHFFFTLPNADTGGRRLIEQVKSFAHSHSDRAFVADSLGSRLYWSLMAVVDIVVGNSSSGLTEAPTFKTATVNIGERQKGRLRPTSCIDCNPDRVSISRAIRKALSTDFQEIARATRNPYGNGGATEQIVQVLESLGQTQSLIQKHFHWIASANQR